MILVLRMLTSRNLPAKLTSQALKVIGHALGFQYTRNLIEKQWGTLMYVFSQTRGEEEEEGREGSSLIYGVFLTCGSLTNQANTCTQQI
jgi:hypothetical protein